MYFITEVLHLFCVSRNYWLQPEEPYWHPDVPVDVPSEAHGQNQNHRADWLWKAPCGSERHSGSDELQRLRHWRRSSSQQSLTWQRWEFHNILIWVRNDLRFNLCASQQDLVDALFTKIQSAHWGGTLTRLLTKSWGPCWMLSHANLFGDTTSWMLMAFAVLVSTSWQEEAQVLCQTLLQPPLLLFYLKIFLHITQFSFLLAF